MIKLKFITPIYLITGETNVDDAGDASYSAIERKIFADKLSVGQNEFYQAHRSGLKPEVKFNIRTNEYAQESKVKFNSMIYTIIRTYDKQDGITEITCTRENSNVSS